MIKIGVIVGGGTGRELADVFVNSLDMIAPILGLNVDITECEHKFSSYATLRGFSFEQIERSIREELRILESFYKRFYSLGGRVIFRTAINAETLYSFRRIGQAVKIIDIHLRGSRLLLVRDETQGFYANSIYRIKDDKIKFTGTFTKENVKAVITFALDEARKTLHQPFDIWVVYKHHLFANIIEQWASECLPECKIYQPNHATELLWQHFSANRSSDLLLIMGNEVGDILYEAILLHLGIGTRQTLFSKNVYLQPDLKNLVEYQTVHGAADHIAGRDLVNPAATLAALGNILEEEIGVQGMKRLVSEAISRAYEVLGPAMSMSTKKFTESVLSYLTRKLQEDLQ